MALGTALCARTRAAAATHIKPTNKSWRVDETYVRVKGRRCYLYRSIDSTGATIDFLLSALRDTEAAKRLFRMALSYHPQPWVIKTDLAPIYGSAIVNIKKEGPEFSGVPIGGTNHPGL